MAQRENVIDVKGLAKHFGDRVAVNGINLRVKQGEIFGFLGPNGSGKTTTIRMLCGLLTPDAGSGTCIGYNVLTQSYEIKQHVGYMAQRFSLYEDLTIYENVNFVASLYRIDDRKRRVRDCIEQLGLTTRQNQLAGTLSGGWKQRLALAVALLHSPKLLLLDEPTAGVDPKARRDFWEQIHQMANTGITTLVSTHYMDEAERCHRLAYILNGNLLVSGTMEEIIEHTHLHTWSVKGEHVADLGNQLRLLPGVEQVAAFGNSLHISSHNEEVLAQTIAAFRQNPEYATFYWKLIKPSLEDAFISLGQVQKEKK